MPVSSLVAIVGSMLAMMVIGMVMPWPVMMPLVVVMMVRVAGQVNMRSGLSAVGHRLRQGNSPQQQLKQHRSRHRNPNGRPERADRHESAKSPGGFWGTGGHGDEWFPTICGLKEIYDQENRYSLSHVAP